jgi:predicted ATPase/signal transduction histidine kinase/tRNA A-37 threonylcarbamoyl transferase component Bud32
MMNVISGYSLREKLYESNNSVVFRVTRDSDGVASLVKASTREHPSPEELSRYQREYDILSSLQIPGVVRVQALERFKSRLALRMEDIGAESLAIHLTRRRFSVEEVLSIALRIVEPLGEIHRRNVIHKDLNPSNIVLNLATGNVQIIDFGLATRLSRENPIVSSPNVLEGTLRYISPEQTGRMNRAVDYRTDFYSLGATLYELLTGVPPFQSEDPVELVHRHIAAQPVSPSERRPEVPAAVSSIVLKLLAKTAEERYQSSPGIKADLEECLGRLRRGESLEGFIPGRRDISERFQSPQKLYGREKEIQLLLSTFERVATGQAELLLVAGYSGVGKSALVNEIHRPILSRRGLFISGKFDQFKRDIPYASLIQAFQGMVRQLLMESEEALAAWRRKLLGVVGTNGGVITAVIPEVERIIGVQPVPQPQPPAESQNRFNIVFGDFVRAFAAAEHPLVIFLDDLQWADVPSLKLLQLLASSPGWQHLLVIGAYRDNEVTGAHPLLLMQEALEKEGAKVTTLHLTPLSQHHVDEYVMDALRCPPERSSSLSRLCFEKTHGNPFFLYQFLGSLHDERLLVLDPEQGEWRWDTEKIRQRGITDNVVELLTGKLRKLPEATQRVLKLSACIGNQFDLETLAVVAECSRRDAAAALWQALVEGLVLPLQESYRLAQPLSVALESQEEPPNISYRFQHDRVQQAAYVLIPEVERGPIHRTIGRLLLASISSSKLEERIFDIVNQLDLAEDLIRLEAERVEVAQLNLLAGRKAKSSGAYEPALHYLETGLRLLPEGSWTARNELAFALHAEAIEAAYLNALLERAQELAEIAMAQAATVIEKVTLLEMKMRFHTARNEIHDTLSTAHQALALLGVLLPPIGSVDMQRMQEALDETKRLLDGRRPMDLLELPEMTDPHMQAAIRIMVTAGPPTYIASALSFVVLACATTNLCLKYGHWKYSASAYSYYGQLQPDVKSKNEFGDLSEALLERYPGEIRTKVLGVNAMTIRHWMLPMKQILPMLLESVQSALTVGDVEFVGYASMHYCKDLFFAGEPLPVVERETGRYVELLLRFKQDFMRLYTAITRQAALNLMGAAEVPLQLIGEAFNEAAMLPVLIEAQNIPSLHLLWVHKALLAYLFGDYVAARAAAEQAQQYAGGHHAMNPLVTQNFYHSLSLLALARDASGEERTALLQQADKNQESLRQWAEDGPANYKHKYLLVEAERARVLGRTLEAMDTYEQAIREAARQQFLQEEAISCERCAEFHLAAGRTKVAEAFLTEARYGYARWGATAKVAQLERRYPFLRVDQGGKWQSLLSTISTRQSSTRMGEELDMVTVMKSARAISGELVLSRLVEAVMRNVVENAGAERGVLLLEREGRLVIEAEWSVGEAAAIPRSGQAAEAGQLLSEAIVNYAARTGESVIVSDATSDAQFASDPYVVAKRPRSVLAAPLMNQGNRVALIYLENNLTVGAFTEGRLEVVKLLLAQAALSIQNAGLFERLDASNRKLEEYSHSLERKVEERTRELREKNGALGRALEDLRTTQQQLVLQEKLASLGAVTAGIAHELKNPLNFVNNFAKTSRGLAEEAVEGLREQAHRLEPTVLENLAALLEDLHMSVTKIGEHGVRANGIINSMLLHARQDSGTREPLDLNALLNQSMELAFHGFRSQGMESLLEIERHFETGLGKVPVSASDMGRVFVNIINNAWYATCARLRKGSPDYKPTVTLSTRSVGDSVEVRIRDNGIGIPREIQDKIFNPFFTTKPPGEGTGLGLSISYDIVVHRHHGRLVAESEPGQWAEFIITLPRQAASASTGTRPGPDGRTS